MPDIAKHRLDRGKPSAVTGFAFFAVDGTLHPVAMAFFGFPGFTPKESDLPDFCLLRCAQAFVPLFAGQAIAQGAAVFGGEVAVVDAVRAVAVELFAGRTGADAGFQIECEVLWPVSLDRFLRVGLVVEWIGLLLVFALILEAFIALAHIDRPRSRPQGERLRRAWVYGRNHPSPPRYGSWSSCSHAH